MKKLLVLALLTLSTLARAETVNQCVAQHFAQARENPRVKYEQDRRIVTIWCGCKTQQLAQGETLDRAVEYCAGATNKPINEYLQKR